MECIYAKNKMIARYIVRGPCAILVVLNIVSDTEDLGAFLGLRISAV